MSSQLPLVLGQGKRGEVRGIRREVKEEWLGGSADEPHSLSGQHQGGVVHGQTAVVNQQTILVEGVPTVVVGFGLRCEGDPVVPSRRDVSPAQKRVLVQVFSNQTRGVAR